MTEPATKTDIDDLQRLAIILGGASIGLIVISVIAVVITLVYVLRLFKPLKDIAFVAKNTRLDVRNIIETLETATKRNPAALLGGDEEDGSERVSPIFTRRMFNAPLTFDLSVLRESGEFEYDRDRSRSPRTHGNGPVAVMSSGARKPKAPSPAVPPRRTHSQGFYGDY